MGTDIFHWRGGNDLLVIDYYSNYPEIAKLSSISSSDVILHMKSIFARHGIPSVVVRDNSSRLYREFAEEYIFFAQD